MWKIVVSGLFDEGESEEALEEDGRTKNMSWGTNSAYPVPWRNGYAAVWEQNLQMCFPDELKDWNPKLHGLLTKYGQAFDDEWWYYLNRKGNVVKRVPVLRTQKKIFSEKPPKLIPRKFEPNKKLLEVLGV